MRTLLRLAIPAVALLASPASAVPVEAVLAGTDGNFTYSVVHTSTAGSDGQSGTILGTVGLGGAGGDWTVVGDVATLDIQLVVDVGGSLSTYDAIGDFSVSALTEFGTQADVMLGSLAFTLAAGGDEAGIDGLTFYFENRNYSSAGDPPNGLELDPAGDVLTLWGATEFTGSGVIGESLDLVAGGRGIDLRIEMGPAIPEPSARPLYLAGLVVVALGGARLRR
jgi:hypothetical protein